MAMYTNVSQRLITLPDLEVMVPGVPMDMADDTVSHPGVQDLIEFGDIVAGDPSPEDQAKLRQEMELKAQQARVQSPQDQVTEQQMRPAPVHPQQTIQAPVAAPLQARPTPSPAPPSKA